MDNYKNRLKKGDVFLRQVSELRSDEHGYPTVVVEQTEVTEDIFVNWSFGKSAKPN